MTVSSGFDRMQTEVNVGPKDLKEARSRRNVFRDALETEADVGDVLPSGSLARGSHCDPIHDVDLIVVYDASKHPEWGAPGLSASNALVHLSSQVDRLLGTINGSWEKVVWKAAPKNHAVKCYLDDPDDLDGFTVDAMPALRQPDGTLLVPESESNGWISTNPEYLIELVRDRHSEWNEFVKLVRILKHWNREHGGLMKSLLVEVLALDCLLKNNDRGQAVAGYFTAANVRLGQPVNDPANLCGPIQRDLDTAAARTVLLEASNIAQKALDAAGRGDEKAAMCHWHELFGEVFPEPDGGCSSLAATGGAVAAVGATIVRTAPRRVRDAPQG